MPSKGEVILAALSGFLKGLPEGYIETEKLNVEKRKMDLQLKREARLDEMARQRLSDQNIKSIFNMNMRGLEYEETVRHHEKQEEKKDDSTLQEVKETQTKEVPFSEIQSMVDQITPPEKPNLLTRAKESAKELVTGEKAPPPFDWDTYLANTFKPQFLNLLEKSTFKNWSQEDKESFADQVGFQFKGKEGDLSTMAGNLGVTTTKKTYKKIPKNKISNENTGIPKEAQKKSLPPWPVGEVRKFKSTGELWIRTGGTDNLPIKIPYAVYIQNQLDQGKPIPLSGTP